MYRKQYKEDNYQLEQYIYLQQALELNIRKVGDYLDKDLFQAILRVFKQMDLFVKQLISSTSDNLQQHVAKY